MNYNSHELWALVLELRNRVEALEAAQPKQITQEELAKLLAQPARVVPLATASAGSLVERIAWMIAKNVSEAIPGTDCTPFASDVLHEVAAWLEDENTDISMGTAGNIAERLRDEAER